MMDKESDNHERRKYHPSSPLARQIWAERNLLRRNIIKDPKQGILKLKEEYKFGEQSELWDEYIFNIIVRPCLESCCDAPLKEAVNVYSKIDGCLFQPYIRREEDPKRFERAFWNVNKYGLRISERVSAELGNAKRKKQKSSKKSLCIIFKGPLKLAHTEFLVAFLIGCGHFRNLVKITIILIDDDGKSLAKLDYLEIISIRKMKDTYSRVKWVQELCYEREFDCTVWVAAVQNLALYMGAKRGDSQGYWSMKYHSIVMPTLNKYAAIGFGGKSFDYEGTEWYRGRAFPYLERKYISDKEKISIKNRFKIPLSCKVVGCFVREEKTHGLEFWEGIKKLLIINKDVVFILASQSLNKQSKIITEDDELKKRFRYIGWVNTKIVVNIIDIYFDSYPRGSCNTIFEAIHAGVPILMTDTELNRESSALIYLQGVSKTDEVDGVTQTYSEQIKECQTLLNDDESKKELIRRQGALLKRLAGQHVLFAKDYLQYFLNSKFTIR